MILAGLYRPVRKEKMIDSEQANTGLWCTSLRFSEDPQSGSPYIWYTCARFYSEISSIFGL